MNHKVGMKTVIFAILVITILLVSGCVAPTPEAEEPTVDSITEDISELDILTEELNMSELENLESELDELSW